MYKIKICLIDIYILNVNGEMFFLLFYVGFESIYYCRKNYIIRDRFMYFL